MEDRCRVARIGNPRCSSSRWRSAVLIALAGLREGRRWGRADVDVAVGLGVVAVGAQLQLWGMAASTLLGEVVALGLGVAALALTRRSVAGVWFGRART